MTHVTTKPVLEVCDQLRLKPACSATETSLGLEISAFIYRHKQETSALHLCLLIPNACRHFSIKNVLLQQC